ncbi:hypothetical protein [Arenimonas composti]|uniref:DUF1232 domain-containing protein n=1 Tax=Arenimonas composti TR7-09 = DSM 18010 TaxID=1121013 RepID=A0A091BD21_9GAMM|nr:hypothetical protein [Arenimonas composti]KFN49636.1 hypothetical protein P873_09725 [Arenimonas composti TR7-09 = DSM 18010]
MNLPLHAETPLFPSPLPLDLRHEAFARRRRIGDVELSDAAVDDFNALLARLAPGTAPVSADQIVTLARWLQSLPAERAAAIVGERLRRAARVRDMLADTDWILDGNLRERARLLVDYLQRVDDLIPDDQPQVGHLDDALLVELSWRQFAAEATDFGDFCRFRALERPRGDGRARVAAWEAACVAELALLQQRRDVRAHRYATGGDLPERIRVR